MILFTPLERMLAWRYLRARRREGFIALTSWFAIIGIALGVATLILVTSLMNGIRDEMTTRFIGIEGHIVISNRAGAFTDYQPAIDALMQDEGVLSITPEVEGQVMATAHGRALGAQVVAVPYSDLQARPLFTEHVTAGSLEGLRDETGIVLGQRLAENLHVGVGDTLTLISPQGRSTIAGFIPRMKSYRLVATIQLGMHALDGGLILMPFHEAQTYFMLNGSSVATPVSSREPSPTGQVDSGVAEANRDDRYGQGAIHNLQITLKDVNAAPKVAQLMQRQLGDDARVMTWQQTNAGIFAALSVQRNVMVIILALIILVAAFNIISSLVMLVKDKAHGIAILRTMGATRSSVMRIFMLAGCWIGAVGTAAGMALGLVLAANIERIHQAVEALTGQKILVEDIYFLSTLPTKTDPVEVVVIVLIALVLSFLATIYPARRAARLDPVEVLRHE